jgi:small subunit ribosomal protein S8
MVNDPIGDLLIQIKNASLAGKEVIEVPYSRVKYTITKILSEEGYVGEVKKVGTTPKDSIRITIKYENDVPAVTNAQRMSKPGLRVYVKKNMIPTVVGGMGLAIISTPQGIMTGTKARKKGIGGEILCTIW